MLQSYLTTALRNILKKKVFSAINIIGLSIGLTAFLLILHYVSFELSYDNFQPNKNQLYRVSLEQYQNGELVIASAENYPALGPALVQDIPEVKEYARLYNLGAKNNIVVTSEQTSGEPTKLRQRRLLYANNSFLKLFGYKALEGDISQALADPFKMVITESTAKKYFGEDSALGKMLRMQDDDGNNELCEVAAVVNDSPANTHLKFDVLISYSTLYARYNGHERARARYDRSWYRKDMYTYILVDQNTDSEILASKFPAIIDKYMPDLAENNRKEVLKLQPVSDIHLYESLDDEAEAGGYGESVYFLLIVAVFILLIAYINYINLATARSLERANEVGVRKVMGAHRGQLLKQFLLESAFMNMFSLLLSLILYFTLLPFFSQLAGLPTREAVWEYGIWHNTWFWILIPGLMIIGALLSGLYPAIILSAFQPVSVLSGKLKTSQSGVFFRKALVIFQFAACVALIIGTFTVYQQLQFLRNQELGYEPSQLVVMERPGIIQRDQETYIATVEGFKEDLKKHSGVQQASATYMIPGRKTRWKNTIYKKGDDPDQSVVFQINLIHFDFVETMQMEILAGRNISKEFGTDMDTACLITHAGVKLLGFKDEESAIGQAVMIGEEGQSSLIVGIVNDYYQESLRQSPLPTLFIPSTYSEHYIARISTNNIPATIAHMEQTWEARFPGNPFHYFFLDEFFHAQYQNDQRFGKIFGLFAILAIIIGCLGLLGLSAFMAQQRAKEISVRKILGANINHIMRLLTGEFIKLILVANIIAWPPIAWIMHNWLQAFSLRVSLNWWLFVLSGLIVLFIALLAVSYQSWRAASIDPIKTLRSEI